MSTYELRWGPLRAHQISGTLQARILAFGMTPVAEVNWTIEAHIVDASGEKRAQLLAATSGEDRELGTQSGYTALELSARDLPLSEAQALQGDFIQISMQAPHLEFGDKWVELSQDLEFTHPTNRKIGKCIYCGTSTATLSREHIIPYGLNGDLVLHNASCAPCGKITSRFEDDALRSALISARTALGMRTRRRQSRPKHLPLVVQRDGIRSKILIPVAEYPTVLALPPFAPLGSGSEAPGKFEIVQIAGMPLEALRGKYRYEYIGIEERYQPLEFARLLAKIGYSYAILHFGPDAFSEVYVLPAIRGEADDVVKWVGSNPGESIGPSTGLHTLTLDVINGDVFVSIRLFAQFNTHEYVVLVGRLG